jgi:flagellar hook-basal body complex protein FliE
MSAISAVGGAAGGMGALARLMPSGIGSIASTDLGAGVDAATTGRADSFGSLLSQGLGSLESLNATAQTKAIAAATGDLTDVQDYVIAASKAQMATSITTTMRNKALESFNEIMRMPL